MSAATQPVNCNNCGAPLDVAAGTNFVTCVHCGSRLAVKRTPTSIFTELLTAIDQRGEVVSRQLAEIAYRAELERIDREWEQEREKYLNRDKEGKVSEPSIAGHIVGGVVGLVLSGFGLFWTLGAMEVTLGEQGIGRFFPCFGVIFIVAGIVAGLASFVWGPAKTEEFNQRKLEYQRRRAAVTVEQFLPKPGGPPAAEN